MRHLEGATDHMVYAYEALIYMLTGRRELIEREDVQFVILLLRPLEACAKWR